MRNTFLTIIQTKNLYPFILLPTHLFHMTQHLLIFTNLARQLPLHYTHFLHQTQHIQKIVTYTYLTSSYDTNTTLPPTPTLLSNNTPFQDSSTPFTKTPHLPPHYNSKPIFQPSLLIFTLPSLSPSTLPTPPQDPSLVVDLSSYLLPSPPPIRKSSEIFKPPSHLNDYICTSQIIGAILFNMISYPHIISPYLLITLFIKNLPHTKKLLQTLYGSKLWTKNS